MAGKKLTTEQFIAKAIKIHDNKYDYSLVNYNGAITDIIIICNTHGTFQQTPHDHLSGCGCKKCSYEKLSNRYKLSLEVFIEKAIGVHGDMYNYSLVQYKNIGTKVQIICQLHGAFDQRPGDHLKGNGCPKCFGNSKLTTQDFITRAHKTHNNFYNYSLTEYIDSYHKVKIICPIHGIFEQAPFSHLNNIGCIKCGIIKNTSTLEGWIIKSNIIHSNKYDYSLSDYKGSYIKLIIVCLKHGSFLQLPSHHLQGHGCPKCSHTISNLETEWLNSLNILEVYRNKRLNINNKIICPDAYDPNANIIYEFYGDFWHGNPKLYDQTKINSATKTTFGELYNKTINKEKLIKEAGYNLITIWENDFKKINKGKIK